jgi:hypothetical protein
MCAESSKEKDKEKGKDKNKDKTKKKDKDKDKENNKEKEPPFLEVVNRTNNSFLGIHVSLITNVL